MIRLAAFGDSLTDPGTYQDLPDQTWLQQMTESLFPVEIASNKASGGAVSGQKEDHVYVIDDDVVETPGLLGQVDEFIEEDIEADIHVIWIGTNDLVIASHLDPYTRPGGNTVTASPRVARDREELNLSQRDYASFIVDNYTVVNIRKAAEKLARRGELIVVGPFCLEKTALANMSPAANHRCRFARERLQQCLKQEDFPHFVDLSDIRVGAVDEIHLDHASQREVMAKIYSVV